VGQLKKEDCQRWKNGPNSSNRNADVGGIANITIQDQRNTSQKAAGNGDDATYYGE
jgi:hypothetical protein